LYIGTVIIEFEVLEIGRAVKDGELMEKMNNIEVDEERRFK
jgi:hypothetical protein